MTITTPCNCWLWTVATVAGCIGGLLGMSGTAALAQPNLEAESQAANSRWSQLEPLPDRIGFAGSYAGVSHDVLLVAGGANFPDAPPWEGGAKQWHDRIFALAAPDAKWTELTTRLPLQLGYGGSVDWQDSVLVIGGGNADEHSDGIYSLRIQGQEIDELSVELVGRLPHPLANFACVRLGDQLVVIGGTQSPQSTQAESATWILDLSQQPPWRVEDWKRGPELSDGGRMLHMVGGIDRQVIVAGGVALTESGDGKPQRVLPYKRDAYRWRIDGQGGWEPLPDLPFPVVAAANPMPYMNRSGKLWLIGGDDGSQVGVTPADHRGFSRRVIAWDTDAACWEITGRIPAGASRVTLPIIRWHSDWILPSGEMSPGIRSPQVWKVSGSSDDDQL